MTLLDSKTSIEPAAPVPAPITPTPHRFTADEYHRLGELGILTPEKRFELFDGGIYEKMSPVGNKHSITVECLRDELRRLYPKGHWVRQEAPLRLSNYSEPEPDVSVVVGERVDYAEQKTAPADKALLVAEVSDQTITLDRGKRLRSYAASSIPIYLIVDLNRTCVEMHTQPETDSEGNAVYASKQTFNRGDNVVLPSGEVLVADLFPWIK